MKHCETCSKKNGCTWQAQVGGKGCRAWEGIPCEPVFSASLAMAGLKMAEESAKKAEQEHDLAIWWEARRAYMTGHFSMARWNEIHDDSLDAWADLALAAYKAKAAELSKTCK